ncbi:hypothetical protein [Curtobacterium sp. ISL-83]|uniref:hypothetical protein n=1 Tax=Curtobacterium sp. ISL-83 TaxID=2819145 RepID=UPI001BEBCAD3|nr:hypothetical protein [Curtobacterium sp. ISL-83]MBT2502210.1 hypothetical protein [Curtobacterium sp. ISL-83]
MSSYESDPVTEPLRIVSMRRMQKMHRRGLTGADELGEPLIDDLFLHIAPRVQAPPRIDRNGPPRH